MPTVRSSLRPTLAVLGAAAALALALAGCAPTPASSSSSAPVTTPPAPSPHEPSVTAAPTPTASVTAKPVGVTCAQLITPDGMYAYNPNFVALTSWSPASGTSAAQAVANKGVACRWQNETSNNVVDLSVANLDAATIESLKNQAVAKSQMVPTYQGADEGYFSVGSGAGTAIVFVKTFWVVMTSQQFAEPGDADQLLHSVITVLATR
jgi:hypothetical protein